MLRFVSPWSTSHMRSMPWSPGTGDAAGHNPLDPNDARFYENGEWLIESIVTPGQLLRGGDNAGDITDEQLLRPSFIIFGERGRTDLSVMAGTRSATGVIQSGKVTVVRIHNFEAITDMANVGAGGVAAGDRLSVWDVDIGGVIRRALDTVAGATAYVQAHCVSVDATALTCQFLVRS